MHSGILLFSQCSHSGSQGLTPRMLRGATGKYCLARISCNQHYQILFKKVFSRGSVVEVPHFSCLEVLRRTTNKYVY